MISYEEAIEILDDRFGVNHCRLSYGCEVIKELLQNEMWHKYPEEDVPESGNYLVFLKGITNTDHLILIKPLEKGNRTFCFINGTEQYKPIYWKHLFIPFKGDIKMEDYKIRMLKEYKELNERCNKLSVMLEKYKNNKLDFTPTCSYDLLKSQYCAMECYLSILKERFRIEGIDREDADKV